ncbi:hypothetical protein PCANC_16548 [Puccinia coronata f. sp. avenae]|uniref:Uncharacterized protein n=1 Tax=Puccinia coronata f. sp. avenae TaxID=200324 RepID=A0A2N5ULF2_9BASI|nr:hypothetical protein PCANC_16548 [Puccinia coronata f. sp. avenae]
MFGSLLRLDNILEETFAKVALFKSWFVDKKLDLEDAKHWFQVDVLGVGEPQTEEQTTHSDIPPNAAFTDVKLNDLIRKRGVSDKKISQMLDSANQLATTKSFKPPQHQPCQPPGKGKDPSSSPEELYMAINEEVCQPLGTPWGFESSLRMHLRLSLRSPAFEEAEASERRGGAPHQF